MWFLYFNSTARYEGTIFIQSMCFSIIKLDNVSIERGSLYLEEYISGSEQYESVESTNLKYLNVNTESDPKYLETETDQYLQE